MENISVIFEKISLYLDSILESLFNKPFSELLNDYFFQLNTGLPDWIKFLVLFFATILIIVGLFTLIKKMFKFFFVVFLTVAAYFLLK